MSTPLQAVALGTELTIPFAAAARDTLHAALRQQPGDLALDLSGITDFDSAGVQLLLATQRTLAERGDSLLCQAPSACVRDALAVFGLGSLLQPSTAG